MTDQKLDFQDTDVKLYLALKALLPYCDKQAALVCTLVRQDRATERELDEVRYAQMAAREAITEFEGLRAALPEWAVDRNWAGARIIGAQLCTKDGRRVGNGFIADIGYMQGDLIYTVITDMGNQMQLTVRELDELYWIGLYIKRMPE